MPVKQKGGRKRRDGEETAATATSTTTTSTTSTKRSKKAPLPPTTTTTTDDDNDTAQLPLTEPPTTTTTSTTTTTLLPLPGTLVVGRVDVRVKPRDPPSITIVMSGSAVEGSTKKLMGRVDVTHLAEEAEWVDDPVSKQKHGAFVSCRVLEASPERGMELSLRPSLVAAEVSNNWSETHAALVKREETVPAVGSVVKGFVVQTSHKGCFVRLSRRLTARVELKNLADAFVQDVATAFPPGKLVAGRVLSADDATKHVALSLRPSQVVSGDETWAALEPGLQFDGVVRNVTDFGVFVELQPGIVGLAHASELQDAGGDESSSAGASKKRKGATTDVSKWPKPSSLFAKGDKVRTVVLRVDKTKRKLSLGMKPSYFASVGDDDEDDGDDDADEAAAADDDAAAAADDDDDDDDDVTLDEALLRTEKVAAATTTTKRARADSNVSSQASTSINKPGGDDDDDDDDDEDDDKATTDKERRPSKKQRDALKKKEQAATAEQEDRLATDAEPQTPDDFERLLVGRPNSSLLWIKYMATLADASELDRARLVSERALRTISYREEQEKMNVWKARLMLEINFGTDATVKTLFERMQRENDKTWALLTLAEAYSEPKTPENQKRLDDAYSKARRSAAADKDAPEDAVREVGLKHVTSKFDWNDAPGGRKLLKDLLRELPKKQQVLALLDFARLEFSHANGDKERGRTVAEGVLETFPKRTDAWHVYIDLETKFGEPAKARALFERAVQLKRGVSVHKIKSLFKKWLAFEKSELGGGAAAARKVTAMAKEFVARLVEREGGVDDADEDADDDGEGF